MLIDAHGVNPKFPSSSVINLGFLVSNDCHLEYGVCFSPLFQYEFESFPLGLK